MLMLIGFLKPVFISPDFFSCFLANLAQGWPWRRGCRNRYQHVM